ncbi:helix-turn-helix domain-containing protein [Paenibacillus xylanilyticus]|uniref:Helix-turn-helix transcriptional regulator n=1 Tax=Paenibacillus xylanilyticus TaxID=248903 RepID=A0A7Y6BVB4_9BACL|nr:helix-turn-helix transcriptional regulator [Paenibacillus xylanilyticus]NUU74614.1 helix-turn-helix transcriptional regulator [Paenibacillus xylanilyticus]
MDNAIGERLKKARKHTNLTQIEVYEKIGINNKTLSGYEVGTSEPDYKSLARLCNLYNVTIDWVITGIPLSSVEVPKTKGIELTSEEFLSNDLLYRDKAMTLTEKRKLVEIARLLFD